MKKIYIVLLCISSFSSWSQQGINQLCQSALQKFTGHKGVSFSYVLQSGGSSVTGRIVAHMNFESNPFPFDNFRLEVTSGAGFSLIKAGEAVAFADHETQTLTTATLLRNGGFLLGQKIGYHALPFMYSVLLGDAQSLGAVKGRSEGNRLEIKFNIPQEGFKADLWIDQETYEIVRIVAYEGDKPITYEVKGYVWSTTAPTSSTFQFPDYDEQEFSVGGPVIGADLSSLIFEAYEGEQAFRMADQLGKVVVLDFWGTWCRPCIGAMPRIQQLHEDYQKKDVVIVGPTYMEKKDPVAFARARGIGYTILNGESNAGFFALDKTGVPALFVIGRDGKLVDYIIGDQGEAGEAYIRKAIEAGL